jgi:hypothetical protein
MEQELNDSYAALGALLRCWKEAAYVVRMRSQDSGFISTRMDLLPSHDSVRSALAG